jgi:metal-responsive CopG/Arc/MetJ family transcriptional regulator
MPTVRQTAFRFTAEDLSILDAIQRRTGIVSRTEVIRMAIRALATAQGISFEGEKRRYASGSGVKRRQKP